MGYDPSGLINWGGVFAGIVIGAIAVAAIAVTVATAGAASPFAAAVVTTVGTTVSAALVEASVVTTVGAVAEVPVVYDVTVVGGDDRVGASLVYDFGENTSDYYLHTGKQSKDDFSITFGSGFVFNYDKVGDYGGTFLDVSASADYKGASLGLDYCTSPENLTDGYKKSHALLLTSGYSCSLTNSKLPTFSYDYYWQIAP